MVAEPVIIRGSCRDMLELSELHFIVIHNYVCDRTIGIQKKK